MQSTLVKATKIGLAVAALMVSQGASAFDVYVSGASALRDSMPRLMNRFCQADSASTPRVINRVASDNDRRVFSCTFHTAATNAAVAAELTSALTGKQVNVFHSVEPGNTLDNVVGGSITGIIPLLAGSTAVMNFANLTNSGTATIDTTFAGADLFSNATQTPNAPQIGLSDVEPKLFTNDFGNLPTDAAAQAAGWVLNGQNPAALTNSVAFVGGFGVAVSKNLLNAGVTNISTEQLAGVLSGEIANWNQIGGPNLPVRVCRRSPGSGTQATFNQLVSRKGCGSNISAYEFAVADASNSQVTENATTTLVKTCLNNANDAATEGAIGILGLENNAVEAKHQIIDVNGIKIWDATEAAGNTLDGTVDNVREDKIISGQYPLVVESTVQKSAKVSLTTDQTAFYNLLATKAGDPIFTKTLPGVVSAADKRTGNVPNLTEGATNFSRSGDTCVPLTYAP